MALDGKVLRRAMDRLEERRKDNLRSYAERRNEVYRKIPKVAEIDRRLSMSVFQAASAAFSAGNDPEKAVEKVARENLELQAERAELLVAGGYPFDYLDEKPVCGKCSDRGYRGSRMCECLYELYLDEQRKELSKLLKLGEETFDNFSLDYYSDEYDSALGMSVRRHMELVYETCVQYARKFGPDSMNLFMTGGTGLGKTFLSTCIAKALSEKGFSVVYDTAISVFSRFEQARFSKGADYEDNQEDIERYFACDVLILDDLGTEMTTGFVVSTLYQLINTRLASGKKTIINSNLSIDEIRKRYSQPIASRLEGEYLPILFRGRDVRVLKREI